MLGGLVACLRLIAAGRTRAMRHVGVCDTGYAVVAAAPLKDKDESCEHADSAYAHQSGPHEALAGLG